MENIILTNNKELRLVGVKVGVLSTLRFELPLVSASATRVEVIVTSGSVHSAYTATFIDNTKCWQCDIAASQFPAVGKQSYEIAYVLDGKQFWDGKGWIEIEDATTSGIEPQPRPEPYRYVVVSVNGYGADAQGAVRIPKMFVASDSPVTTEGYMEGDIYFNKDTGATWTLCDVSGTLVWVFNYSNYYTKAETDEQIDRVAAYYITYDAQGNSFPTRAALLNAQTYYSGGAPRTPTRNDYAVVLADETHDGAEWRYIYAVADGQTTGQWEPQYPVDGVIILDNSVTRTSANGVKSSGIWGAIWGALAALPAGFTSLYDLCVAQLAGKASTADATLTERGFSKWTITAVPDGLDPSTVDVVWGNPMPDYYEHDAWHFTFEGGWEWTDNTDRNATSLSSGGFAATRTALQGYRLGPDEQTNPNRDKPLASEAEAEALRQGKQNALTAQQLANIAAVSDALAFDATHSYAAGDPVVYNGTLYTFTAAHTGAWTGNDVSAVDIIARLAAKADNNSVVHKTGNETIDGTKLFSGWRACSVVATPQHFIEFSTSGVYSTPFAILFQNGDANSQYRYALPLKSGVMALLSDLADYAPLNSPAFTGTPTAPTTASGTNTTQVATTAFVQSEKHYSLVTKTISNGAVTLDDRAINAVAVSSALASLTVNFPTATSGKARDFGLRLTVASGITTAPELVLPQGVTCENADGEAPEIGADGAATILYFTETASGVFLVKGEVLQTITA